MVGVRMHGPESQPANDAMTKWVGTKKDLWTDLRDYLDQAYGIEPEVRYGGKNYGWCLRYRKGGKTLVTLYPEHDSFTVLVVMGSKEIAKAEPFLAQCSDRVREQLANTEQLHDGRWLWLQPQTEADVDSVKSLLAVKRRVLPTT